MSYFRLRDYYKKRNIKSKILFKIILCKFLFLRRSGEPVTFKAFSFKSGINIIIKILIKYIWRFIREQLVYDLSTCDWATLHHFNFIQFFNFTIAITKLPTLTRMRVRENLKLSLENSKTVCTNGWCLLMVNVLYGNTRFC